ncbi:MAG: HEAT repeat domain-containing protein, partial [Chlorobiaceae bacterium]|nr:HEAT repeat domain-containing protein [Chlorobiaceae bacterium]
PGLTKALTEDNASDVRGSAANALGSIGDRTAVPGLTKALTEDNASDVRGSAANALGSIGDRTAVPGLTKALTEDIDSIVRGSAANALGLILDPSCIEKLQIAITDSDAIVRSSIGKALIRFDDISTLSSIFELCKDENDKVRGVTLNALLSCHSPEKYHLLFQQCVFDDQDGINRTNAIRGLGLVGSSNDIPVLMRALYDKDAGARGEAARALVLLFPKINIDMQNEIADKLLGYWIACRHSDTFYSLSDAISRLPSDIVLKLMQKHEKEISGILSWKKEYSKELFLKIKMIARCSHELKILKYKVSKIATKVWRNEFRNSDDEISEDIHRFIKSEESSLWSKFNKISSSQSKKRFKEFDVQQVMETYWKGMARGDVHKEIRAGTGRVDLWVYYGLIPVIFELKMLESIREDYENGLMQLREYLKQNFVKYGVLFLFAEEEQLYNELFNRLNGNITKHISDQQTINVAIVKSWKPITPSSIRT